MLNHILNTNAPEIDSSVKFVSSTIFYSVSGNTLYLLPESAALPYSAQQVNSRLTIRSQKGGGSSLVPSTPYLKGAI